jgi:hypothetical protein
MSRDDEEMRGQTVDGDVVEDVLRYLGGEVHVDTKEVGIRLSLLHRQLDSWELIGGLTSSRFLRSVWNHSKLPVSRLHQMNSTRRRDPSLFCCCMYLRRISMSREGGGGKGGTHQIFLRMEAKGVTPIPVPMRIATAIQGISRSPRGRRRRLTFVLEEVLSRSA